MSSGPDGSDDYGAFLDGLGSDHLALLEQSVAVPDAGRVDGHEACAGDGGGGAGGAGSVLPRPAAPYLTMLNEEQVAAVLADIERPCVITAGAGSGKTRVIIARYRHILATAVPPVTTTNLWAVTFTRAAANEMRQRIQPHLGAEAMKNATLSTFHSFAARLCRTYLPAKGEARLDDAPAGAAVPRTYYRDFKLHWKKDDQRLLQSIILHLVEPTLEAAGDVLTGEHSSVTEALLAEAHAAWATHQLRLPMDYYETRPRGHHSHDLKTQAWRMAGAFYHRYCVLRLQVSGVGTEWAGAAWRDVPLQVHRHPSRRAVSGTSPGGSTPLARRCRRLAATWTTSLRRMAAWCSRTTCSTRTCPSTSPPC